MAIQDATWINSGYGEYFDFAEGYRINGDTVVDQITYKKVYKYFMEVTSEQTADEKEYLVTGSELSLLIRDDIEARKVYAIPIAYSITDNNSDSCFIQSMSGEEFLLYDFSLSVGDTLSTCLHNNHEDLHFLIERDTLIERFNVYRRALYHQSGFPYVIEGIGYTSGFLRLAHGLTVTGKGMYIDRYCIGSEWNCGLHTSTTEIENKGLIITPNPVDSYLLIQTEKEVSHLRIHNVSGVFVDSMDSYNKDVKWNVDALLPGIYFISGLTNDSAPFVMKFVKK